MQQRILADARSTIEDEGATWASVALEGRDLQISGQWPTAEGRDHLLTRLRQTPGVRVVLDATDGSPSKVVATRKSSRGQGEACQRELDALLADETIQFEVLSAAIRSASLPLLERLAEALQRCPDSHIEICGHTDGKGIPDLNLRLSQARAESIRNFLIHQGIAADRLVAVGYGSSQPVADDSSEEGRMLNRRIEFKVQGIDS
jgi:OOP family OmpA-OmpF porin